MNMRMEMKAMGRAYLAMVPGLLLLPLLAASCKPGSPAAPATQPAMAVTDWRPLFDGKTLRGWKAGSWGGDGKVWVEGGAIHVGAGATCTGAIYDPNAPDAAIRDLPRDDYELKLEGKRVEGSDFFCALTFPVGKDYISLVLGGWGGQLVGLSSLDGMDASENTTSQVVNFEGDRWYRIRVRVSKKQIRCWLDDKQIIEVPRGEHKIGVRAEMDESKPLGLATYQTHGASRDIRLRVLELGEE